MGCGHAIGSQEVRAGWQPPMATASVLGQDPEPRAAQWMEGLRWEAGMLGPGVARADRGGLVSVLLFCPLAPRGSRPPHRQAGLCAGPRPPDTSALAQEVVTWSGEGAVASRAADGWPGSVHDR